MHSRTSPSAPFGSVTARFDTRALEGVLTEHAHVVLGGADRQRVEVEIGGR